MMIYKNIDEKINYLKSVRDDIKKNKLVFNENKDNFGFDSMKSIIKVKNDDEIKGYPFKIDDKRIKTKNLALKVIPFDCDYNKDEHPSNLEIIILKKLTDSIVLTNISPHITFYLGCFKINNKNKALAKTTLKKLYMQKRIKNKSIVLISEYVNSGSLDKWYDEIYNNDNIITNTDWKIIIFQIVYTLYVLQYYFKLNHNDSHCGNILIDRTIQKDNNYYVYEIKNTKFYIKNNGILPKLFDFEFAMSFSDTIKDSYPNKYIIDSLNYDKKLHKTIERTDFSDNDIKNFPVNFSEIYDLHFFLTSILELSISTEINNWIVNLYPMELIPDFSKSDSSSSDSSSFDTSDSDSSSSTDSTSNSESSTKSNTSNYQDSENDSKDSDNDSKDSEYDSKDSDINSSNDEFRYLKRGRIINGIETQFENLPTPGNLLFCEFFKEFTIIPSDFNEDTAIYFKSGIV